MTHLHALSRSAAPTLALLLLGAALPAGAQTLGGQVVELETRKPLAGAGVALVNDSARIVASGTATDDGSFYLDAPTPGAFRLVLFVSGASFVVPSVTLDSGRTVERLFSVPIVPEALASTFFARDVTRPAASLPSSPKPAYPADLARKGTRALVTAMFVVAENGRPDLASFHALGAADQAFIDAIREAVARTRFVPADKDGTPVRQVVQYVYDFARTGEPARGDVMVRTGADTARVTVRSPVRDRWIISAEELASSEVERLMLPEAMHLLRPRLYNARYLSAIEPASGPIFVNEVQVEGMSTLRNIPAKYVEEVRYWKREDAKMRFGMQYQFAVTIKLKPEH